MLRSLLTVGLVAAGAFAANVAPSQSPPGGLTNAQTPQFIVLGSDDNTSADGLTWLLDYISGKTNPGTAGEAAHGGAQMTMSFYQIGAAMSDAGVVTGLQRAMGLGCEVGNHTMNHTAAATSSSVKLSQAAMTTEISDCSAELNSKLGISSPAGFRQPYLQWSNNGFAAVKAAGFRYDCSLNDGHEWWATDATVKAIGTYMWPYTLDGGAPLATDLNDYWSGTIQESVANYAGLWEIPCYQFVGPQSDAECSTYGCPSGFVARLDARTAPIDPATGLPKYSNGGKLTGLDFNLFANPAKLDKADALAVLKSTLDKMYAGNRTPLTIGLHSQYYVEYDEDTAFSNIQVAADRRWVVEQFIAYALSKPDVRFVSGEQLVDWLENPKAIGVAGSGYSLSVTATNGSVAKSPSASSYASGTVVTLTATPNVGYHFVSWSGDASGTSNEITVTMDAAKSVTATFAADVVVATDSIDMFNTVAGYWYASGSAAPEPVSTIDTTVVSAGLSPMVVPYTIAKQTNDSTYDTWVNVSASFPVVFTSATSVKITYKSDKPVELQLVQSDFAGESNYYSKQLPVAANVSTVTLALNSTIFKQPADWGTPGTFNLANVKEISLAPVADVTAAAASGTLEIRELVVYGIKEDVSAVTTPATASVNQLAVASRDNNLLLSVPSSGLYTVDLIGLDGRKITTLANGTFGAGMHAVAMGVRTPGVYLARISGVNGVATGKIVIR